MQQLDARGIETRPVFYPMHVLPPYRNTAGFPVADLWAHRGINLPTHLAMTREDARYVAAVLHETLAE